MRIAIASFQVPFQQGGATHLAQGLLAALREQGHQVDLITHPFRFFPDAQVQRAMEFWASEDFTVLNMMEPDLVIPLSFPAFYCQHPRKRAWIMHQFRGAYELYDAANPHGISASTRAKIQELDTRCLNECERVFTIADNVTGRLARNNGVPATTLYHPPPLAEAFYSAPAQPFIFAPSRIETLKRQDLLVRAMALTKSPVVCVIAGMGGQYGALLDLVGELGLQDRVRLVGAVSDEEKISYYAHCLGVFFGPHDEDYGYVTLEAMLAAKPVITCTDSGGPLEFVLPGESGLVLEPTPKALAQGIDLLWADRKGTLGMGRTGREIYASLKLSWQSVVQTLLEE